MYYTCQSKKIRSRIFLLGLLVIGVSSIVNGQSDNCNTATVVNLVNGTACVNGSTASATSSMTMYNTCNTNPVNEVWYTFVSQGGQNDFTITPQGGTPISDVEIVVDIDGCGNGAFANCVVQTGSNTLTTGWGTPPGTQVWVAIASNGGNEGDFEFCVNSYDGSPGGGNACSGAIPICDDQPFTFSDMSTLTSSGIAPTCFPGGGNMDVWFEFTVTQTGTLEWQATPLLSTTELDWTLFNITNGCTNAPEEACNYNYADATGAPVGIMTGGCAPCPTSGFAGACGEFCDPITVTAGNTYAIQIDNFSMDGGGFDFLFGPGMTALIAPVADFSISPIGPQCANSVTINITDNSVGTPDYDFGNGNTYSGNNPAPQTYPASGTYGISAIFSGPCPSVHTEFVQVFGPLQPVITTNSDSCNSCNGAADVQVTGGSGVYTYNWGSGESGTSVLGLCSGGVNLTVTDAVCGDTAVSGTISPTGSGSNPTITSIGFCPGDPPTNLNADVAGGLWSGPGITDVNNGTFDPALAGVGSHVVNYTITAGCGGQDSETIIVSAQLDATITPQSSLCVSASPVTLIGASAGGAWAGNGITNSNTGLFDPSVSGTGTHIITYTITGSCGNSDTETVVVDNLNLNFATFNASCNNLCDGSAIVIPSGGTQPYAYIWSGGQTTASVQNLCDGGFTLSVTDVNGCYADTNFTISEPSGFIVNTNSISANCGQSDGLAEVVNVAGGSPSSAGYVYSWTPIAGFQAQLPNVSSGVYNVVISDSAGCDTTLSVNVSNVAGPTATVTHIDVSCFSFCDGTASVNGSSVGGTGNFSYAWSNGQLTQTATGLCAGSYSVTLTDINSCQVSNSVVVNQPTEVVVTASSDSMICLGGSFDMSAFASGGSGSGYVYNWNNGGVGSNPAGVSPVSSTCYTVSATDAFGCASLPATLCVSLYPQLNVSALADQTICPGGSVQLNAMATGGIGYGYSYFWTTNSGNVGSSPAITDAPAGNNPDVITYNVMVQDACETPPVTAQVVVDFHIMPVADFSVNDRNGCEPHEVIFSNLSSYGNTCLWNLGEGSIIQTCDTVIYTYENVGSYDVSLTVISADGCTDVQNRVSYIEVYPVPMADFTIDPQIANVMDSEVSFYDASWGENIANYSWNFMDNNDWDDTLSTSNMLNPTYTYSSEEYSDFSSGVSDYNYFSADTGTYPVGLTVTTAEGCSHDTVHFVEIEGAFRVNIPNAFTPNGDGINDEFFPKGMGIDPVDNYRFMVYNRWGDMIWESSKFDEGWDGVARKVGGQKLVELGVYVWKLELQEYSNIQRFHTYVGHVTVVR